MFMCYTVISLVMLVRLPLNHLSVYIPGEYSPCVLEVTAKPEWKASARHVLLFEVIMDQQDHD